MEYSLWHQIKTNPLALGVSVLLHVVLLVIVSVSLDFSSRITQPNSKKVNTMQAVVVDAGQVDAEVQKLKQAEQQKQHQEAQRKKKAQSELDAARKKRQQEERRLAALKRKQEHEKKQQQLAQKKLEQERQQKQAALEKLKKEQELLEKKRQAEQQRLAAIEAKRKAQEEAERKQKEAAEAEARRKAEEADLQRRLAEEEKQNSRLSKLRSQYILAIIHKVERNWLQPANTQKGWQCDVLVHQNLLGEVTDVSIQKCTGSDAFKASVDRAVRKASPLPAPSDQKIFEKKLQFTFRPEL